MKGDYANLVGDLNLNLSDELCGVLGNQMTALCTGTTAQLPSGKARRSAEHARVLDAVHDSR